MSTTTTSPPHGAQTTPLRVGPSARRTRSLGRYVALDTEQAREVVSLSRPDGSTLIVDYQLDTLSDGLLIAHLSPDEPPENAHIVSDLYLADDTKGRCRAVTPEDFDLTRHATPPSASPTGSHVAPATPLRDSDGRIHRIAELPLAGAPLGDDRRELRWT
ncbi:MAG TPA: hypothetical protein VK538_04555, partial [Solirubrobacteraceae bacterium]|nr:hypothetical protein [Solirubrobacteraceae bacterium]